MDFRGIAEKSSTRGILNRRQFVSTVGFAGLSLGTMGTVSARGGRKPLKNEAVDILIYWSSGDEPNNFGYPGDEKDDQGSMIALHDPKEGGMFDFSKFELTPNGATLHNTFELFHGMLLASKPPSYPLVHQGDGRYKSRGQVMNFEAAELDTSLMTIPQPLLNLSESSWRAVGNDISQLKTDPSGNPLPEGEWGVTRVDIFDHQGGPSAYELSLLYLMWVNPDDDAADREPEAIPQYVPKDANDEALDLIEDGLSNPGGQPSGRRP